MKKNVRSKIWAMAVAGSVFFISACNNSDYTKSPAAEGGNAPSNTDTMNNSPMKDTTSAALPGSTSGKTANKKGKVTIGNMSEKRTTGIKPDKDGVYEMTDTRPMYPGGQAALENYVNNNI